ncbi:MAG: MmgE/PrpD family protein [Pseudomonadota bacterium]
MTGVTADLARWIARGDDPPTPRARRATVQAMLDWTGVTIAGASDPLVDLLIADASAQTGPGQHPIIGTRTYLPSDAAARIMGAASHALDFDDINKRMRGHPTVVILPAILAALEDHSGAATVDALVTGTEIACVLGEMMGEPHYAQGFHTTATVGTVAAAAGVCRLMGASTEDTARALALAATQASGLRAVFGTMAKPLHAGLAAEAGFRAARWAMQGMTAPMDGIEAAQGFGPVLSESFRPIAIRADRLAPFGVEENVFKRHAACYYTHSAIDAAKSLAGEDMLQPNDIRSVHIGLQPGLHSVCDIVGPTTGLEVKFSVRHLVAMAILDRDTTDPHAYDADLARDPDLVTLSGRIDVEPLETENRMEASIRILRRSGEPLERRLDVSQPAQDLDQQEDALVEKFTQLARPVLGHRTDDLATRILALDTDAPLATLLADLMPET